MLLINNIGLLATAHGTKSLCGIRQNDDVELIPSAAVLTEGDRIVRVFREGEEQPSVAQTLDANGGLVTAGLVDAHTHLVFGGWRQHEVPLKLRGAGYLEILAAGGGILNTLKATRSASEDELYLRAAAFLDEMLAHGVTTVEIKSGYGLDLQNELKQLRVINRLAAEGGYDVVPTFMAAHAVPPEFSGNADGYVDYICDTILPQVIEKGLARYCDVFCETGVFNVGQSRRVLLAAQKLGLPSKIHADEIDAIGGSELAGEIRAVSCEHLIAADAAGIASLADGGVTACLLPATSFYLGKEYAPARRMIDAGVPVSICTDFNPGSCPSNNLQFCMNLGLLKYRMSAAEVLCAVTQNAACAVGLGDTRGTVEVGKLANLIVWDAPDLDYIVYRMGSNLVSHVINKGVISK